jgi:hypothetical protein
MHALSKKKIFCDERSDLWVKFDESFMETLTALSYTAAFDESIEVHKRAESKMA